MEKRKVNGATIKIDDVLLLKILQLEGGTIHKVYKPEDCWFPNYTSFLIEHPDLPEVELGERIMEITPTFQSYYSKEGNLINLERIDPPKKGEQIYGKKL